MGFTYALKITVTFKEIKLQTIFMMISTHVVL